MTLIKSMTPGNEVIGFYLAKELQVRQTNGTPAKDYFDITLCDASSEINAKFWDPSPDDKELIFSLDIVKVQGVVQLYQEKPQLKVTRMRKATSEDGYVLTDFIRSAPVQAVDLLHTIKTTAASIQDTSIRAIVEFCIAKVGDKLMHYPAGKSMHHAFYAGLAYHICRMIDLGESICRQRPFLNPDYLKAGIILHDIAKTEEMDAQLGVVSDYSLSGKLLGHIAIACNWVNEAVFRLELSPADERIIALQHIILSHHNKGEWGSPVQPQLAEAVALHYIDQLDAKLQAVEDAIDMTSDHELWTKPIRVIENKPVFRLDQALKSNS